LIYFSNMFLILSDTINYIAMNYKLLIRSFLVVPVWNNYFDSSKNVWARLNTSSFYTYNTILKVSHKSILFWFYSVNQTKRKYLVITVQPSTSSLNKYSTLIPNFPIAWLLLHAPLTQLIKSVRTWVDNSNHNHNWLWYQWMKWIHPPFCVIGTNLYTRTVRTLDTLMKPIYLSKSNQASDLTIQFRVLSYIGNLYIIFTFSYLRWEASKNVRYILSNMGDYAVKSWQKRGKNTILTDWWHKVSYLRNL